MKKWILLVALALALQGTAQAYVPFDFTGYRYYKDDVIGWVPDFSTNYTGYTTASGGSNTTGCAFKFILEDPTHMTGIVSDVTLMTEAWPGVEDFDSFWFSVYDTSVCSSLMCRPGETIHDWSYGPGHLAYQTDRLFFSDQQYTLYDGDGNRVEVNSSLPSPYLDYLVPVDMQLMPGEYWLSMEWDYADKSASCWAGNFRYDMLPFVVPEPCSLALLGFGFLGACRHKKRGTKGRSGG